jgi:hypothetical protein
VITNQTYHTVGDHFILVSTDASPDDKLPLRVYPNPAGERVYFDAAGWFGGALRFTLTDAGGRVVYEQRAVQLPMALERGQLISGMYFFQFSDLEGGLIWSGKVVIR